MIILAILDGWGINTCDTGNAFKAANTPNIDKLLSDYPGSVLTPSGPAAGLPEGQMGNSEVGHLNLGAGRIVNQSIQQINIAIQDGSFFKNPELIQAFRHAKEHNTAVHFMGLLSDGGVHTMNTHLYALLELAKRENFQNVYVHCFMDGRDTAPTSGKGYIEQLQAKMDELGVGRIASICGRYYAMDRDKRWERVERGYNLLVKGEGTMATDPVAAMQASYDKGITDEFIEPIVITREGKPLATIKDYDSVVFFNFRPDRAREISYAFVNKDFEGFPREWLPHLYYVCMTQYDVKLPAPVAFKPSELTNVLAEVLANNKKTQLHIAETEKYAHVTFFFNGGVEKQFAGEERILIPSPKVPTYDLQPEMSAYEVTDKVLEAIDSRKYDVIILNYANPDMVGHTGIMEAAVKAMEAIDTCVGKVVKKALQHDDKIIMTSDHGNLECMVDVATGEPFTAHTSNDVPVVFISSDGKKVKLKEHTILADIAPTILQLLGISKPAEMTGSSIIV